MRRQMVAAIRMLVAMTVVCGVIYPLAVTGIAQLVSRDRANGSLVELDGTIVGSSLIGQAFDGREWFHGRPDGYDPTASGASNLGPSNPALGTAAMDAADAARAAEGLRADASLPVDAVTTSGSGLDPDISPAFARLQASRVAQARGLSREQVLQLIDERTKGRTWGILGEPRVNVLLLNLALERLASQA
jgi:potassium-transporting ATPase KdpC subunit